MEALAINGSNQPRTYDVRSIAANLPTTIDGGSGNDSFNLGNGDIDATLSSNATVNGTKGNAGLRWERPRELRRLRPDRSGVQHAIGHVVS
jgi:hypothetical protein